MKPSPAQSCIWSSLTSMVRLELSGAAEPARTCGIVSLVVMRIRSMYTQKIMLTTRRKKLAFTVVLRGRTDMNSKLRYEKAPLL